jgi:glucose-1-phosphate cytidylyltransferase
LVTSFKEKPQLQKGWINGGFFVIEPEFLKFIENKNVMLERSPLTKAVKTKNLAAYKHEDFWFCMDTLRDKKVLDAMIKTKKSPWLN